MVNNGMEVEGSAYMLTIRRIKHMLDNWEITFYSNVQLILFKWNWNETSRATTLLRIDFLDSNIFWVNTFSCAFAATMKGHCKARRSKTFSFL